MSAPLHHTSFTEAQTLTWSERWEQARGTWSEKQTLLEIAAEEKAINGASWLFCAAYDAATRPADERDEHIARFEEELEALTEAHAAYDRACAVDVRRAA